MQASKLVLAIVSLAASACVQLPTDDEQDGGDIIFYAQGQTTSATPGVLATLWGVSSSSPDYSYQYGGLKAISETSFIANFTGPPPDDALNSDGVGVGVVVLFQPGTAVPSGVQPEGFGAQVLGFTSQHAIIYRKPGTTSERWWAKGFQEGFSCGRCAAPPAGESFEGYQPTICSELVLELNPQDSCDWT